MTELEEWWSSGKARLLPKVTFGLGAAVLAGVVVVTVPTAPAVPTTAGLGAVINAITGNSLFQTTCCGSPASLLQIPG